MIKKTIFNNINQLQDNTKFSKINDKNILNSVLTELINLILSQANEILVENSIFLNTFRQKANKSPQKNIYHDHSL